MQKNTLAYSANLNSNDPSFKIFTSGYSDHLLAYTVDVATHDVLFDKPINVEPNFSFGHVSYTYNSIYFVHEVNDYDGNSNTGAVSRWTIGEGETLTKQEVFVTNGQGPCHVVLDENNGILHVANYGGGSYSAYSVDKSTGQILEEIFFEDYGEGSNVDPDRQADAHAHMVFFVDHFVYVVDLGSDEIHRYQVRGDETKEIIKDPSGSTFLPPGWGPRHMTLAARYAPGAEPRIYVINELKPFISIFAIDEETGILRDVGVMETINSPGSAGAEITVHPNGHWLYCSNRDTSGAKGAILVYNILPDGNLEEVQVQPTSGSMPRHFRIQELEDDDMLFVVDQNGNTLETFLINEVTGRLTLIDVLESNNSPTFIGFL